VSQVKRLFEYETERLCECGSGCTLDYAEHEEGCPAREFLTGDGGLGP
jgi:hypothetical protein